MSLESLLTEKAPPQLYVSQIGEKVVRVPTMGTQAFDSIDEKINSIKKKRNTTETFHIDDLIEKCIEDKNEGLMILLVGLLILAGKTKMFENKKLEPILEKFPVLKIVKDISTFSKCIFPYFVSYATIANCNELVKSINFKKNKKIDLNGIENWFKRISGKNIVVEDLSTLSKSCGIIVYSYLMGYMLHTASFEKSTNGIGISFDIKNSMELIKLKENNSFCVIKTFDYLSLPIEICIGEIHGDGLVEKRKTNERRQPILFTEKSDIEKVQKFALYSSLFKNSLIENSGSKENANCKLQIIHKKIFLDKVRLY